MSSPSTSHLAPARALLAALVLLAACDREDRRFRESPPGNSPTEVVRLSPLQPGPAIMAASVDNEYEENAFAVSQGHRLFVWYNCNGCHANGGGGMGPALMDDEWVYGSSSGQIYRTILEGRPNGMPSWAGRIPDSQMWQIVAYVRSLSGLTPQSVRAGRVDHMMTFPESQVTIEPADPKQSFVPPASKHP